MPVDPLELFFGRRFSDESPQQKVTSLGSGVIVSKEGHIVTNNHVLNGTDDVAVQLSEYEINTRCFFIVIITD